MASAEIKCSSKHSVGVYVRTAKNYIIGKEGDARDILTFSGLGSAISVCIGASTRLEKDGLVCVEKVETDLPEMKGDDQVLRMVPHMKITMKVVSGARDRLQKIEA